MTISVRPAGPFEIVCIVLTHGHPDHTGSAKAIHDLTSGTVAAHTQDRHAIENPDLALLSGPALASRRLSAARCRSGGSSPKARRSALGRGWDLRCSIPRATRRDRSPLLRSEGALFTGDAVQAPGRMPIFTDPSALVRSLRRLKAIPGLLHYLPGHDQPAEGAALNRRFDDSIAHIRRFHAAVKQAALETGGKPDPQESRPGSSRP